MGASAGSTLFERNLGIVAARSPQSAEAIRSAPFRQDVVLEQGPDGVWRGRDGPRLLCSARDPEREARRFAQDVDVRTHAATVVRGFGLGHHVRALADRVKRTGAVIVFEPDVSLLRAVLERVDLGAITRTTNFVLLTDPRDAGAIASATGGLEAVLSAGTTIVDHPPSRARLGEAASVFAESFTRVMKAVRTNVVTTLVQVDVTVRNLLQNLGHYATVPGVADLAGSQAGRAAVVVSAGPSLRRNLHLLAAPGVRDRVVIIATQTVLKPMLAAGIRPHYVTALDYHEISRRFYEGLTPEDVEGVTLVAEPKANPAILAAYPGAVRCPSDHVLDRVLGEALSRDRGTLQPGATVAHLAYYLARHMGCDPVILVGQDLGFTDGQYYAAGAAIHRVWMGELGEFRTLEMLEWERIARMRSLLREVPDQRGGRMYTDEQMATYLVQFEREFLADARRGLTTIDATEGGVRKQHTTIMPLAEALSGHGKPARGAAPNPPATGVPMARVEARLEELTRSARGVIDLANQARAVLERMLERQHDQPAVNRMIAEINALATRAAGQEAYWLVQHINQTGQLNRFKADRAIELDPGLSELQRQRKEIERDITNVRWMAEAGEEVASMLDDALRTLRSGEVATRDVLPKDAGVRVGEAPRAWACVTVSDVGGLGVERDVLGGGVGTGLLDGTLERIGRCAALRGVLLIDATRRGVVKSWLDARRDAPWARSRIEVRRTDPGDWEARAACVGAGRLWARHAWRGGVANLTCFDEAADPRVLAPIAGSLGIDACVVLGADWRLIDPALVDAVVRRHEERPGAHPITFTQAPPGLAPMLVARGVLEELAAASGPMATLGALLGYIPIAPQGDPIAKPVCVGVPPVVRDALARFIPDTPGNAERLARAMGAKPASTSAEEAARRVGSASPDRPVEAVTAVLREGDEPYALLDAIVEAASEGDAPGLTIDARALPAVPAPWIAEIASHARSHGYAGVHLRTHPGGLDAARMLVAGAFGIGVVSVDLYADTQVVYDAHRPGEVLDRARERVWELVRAAVSRGPGGLPMPWIVPRITKTDAAYADVEPFYNRWLMVAGAAVIDPSDRAGERIEPLPVPPEAARRLALSRRTISPREAVTA